ncbi:hypothetical protein LMG23994_05260 [Cupriavidus pinatubonensis]|uniref:Transposase n=1 Tax=Cupriavidus pinatubonensis TaxID=248026 RepID=A0ABN7ZD66_9BURK|nr:hypothetical protein LMG23994_05260 [Cupriavidus pinatubonensis]
MARRGHRTFHAKSGGDQPESRLQHGFTPSCLSHDQRYCNPASADIEWLTDNGSGYTADKTRAIAADLGLKPFHKAKAWQRVS